MLSQRASVQSSRKIRKKKKSELELLEKSKIILYLWLLFLELRDMTQNSDLFLKITRKIKNSEIKSCNYIFLLFFILWRKQAAT